MQTLDYSLKKITQLQEIRFRTRHAKDPGSNGISSKSYYIGKRAVQTAGAIPRLLHYLIDRIVIFLIWIALVFLEVMPSIYIIREKNMLLLWFLVSFGYYLISELLIQQTLGKLITRHKVINVYAAKPSALQVLIRTFIRYIPFEFLSFLGEQTRGWHDQWSGTWVVPNTEEQTLKQLVQLPDPEL